MFDSMLISEVADGAGVHPETVRRLEKRGAIPRAIRDVNGWRRYPPGAVEQIKKLYAADSEGRESRSE